MPRIEDIVIQAIEEFETSAESAAETEQIRAALPTVIDKLIERLPEDMLASIKYQAAEGLERNREAHSSFVERNYSRWKEGFDLLELLVYVAAEAGDAFNERLRQSAVEAEDVLFDVLVRLHGKGCLIGREICCLLNNGFADGAHARWRALHELTVTAIFLAKHGEEAAYSFRCHEVVDSYKAARQHREYADRLNARPLTDAEFQDLKRDYEEIVDQFGKEFTAPYGWAARHLSARHANFSALEADVELDHWRPYYKWASHSVHANSKTLQSFLGTSDSSQDLILVGPSNAGMADPGHSAAISLVQLTSALLTHDPNVDDAVVLKVLLALSEEVGAAFVPAEEE